MAQLGLFFYEIFLRSCRQRLFVERQENRYHDKQCLLSVHTLRDTVSRFIFLKIKSVEGSTFLMFIVSGFDDNLCKAWGD